MRKASKIRPLTEHQQNVLEFITQSIRRDGRPPTIREIGSGFGIGSTNAVRGILNALEHKGHLKRHPFLSRGIELSKPPTPAGSVVRVPILGRVAAGIPLLAVENLEGEILIDRDLIRTDNGFGLKVKGDSMIEAGINDGDFVLARSDVQVEPGDIVVALIGDEATVKRWVPSQNAIRLEPANPKFQPIVIKDEDPNFRIAGKVIGLYRRY